MRYNSDINFMFCYLLQILQGEIENLIFREFVAWKMFLSYEIIKIMKFFNISLNFDKIIDI